MAKFDLESKILTVEEFVRNKKAFGKGRTVLVGGCFDIFHFGHLQFLSKAKEAGDILIVALESDVFLTLRKKREPIHNQKQRAQILAALEVTDIVITLPFLKTDGEYFALVKQVAPSVIAVTAGDPQLTNKKRHADAVGARLVVVTPHIKGFSSTKLKVYAPFSRD